MKASVFLLASSLVLVYAQDPSGPPTGPPPTGEEPPPTGPPPTGGPPPTDAPQTNDADVCPTTGPFQIMEEEVLGDIRFLTTDGCPAHDWSSQSVPNDPHKFTDAQTTVSVWANPTFAESPIPVGIEDPFMGGIGLAWDGVAYYSPVDADGEDAVLTEGETLDYCYGHADFDNVFHYHYIPDCMAIELSDGEHSEHFGYILDGFSIYGLYEMFPEAPTDLDQCNGHWDAERGYHYHLTEGYPYTIGCFRGCPFENENFNMNTVGVDCMPTAWDGSPIECSADSECPEGTVCACSRRHLLFGGGDVPSEQPPSSGIADDACYCDLA